MAPDRHASRDFDHSVLIVAFDDGPEVGHLLARSGTSDVVDAHLVVVRRTTLKRS
jgi:hypothetical protein